MKKLVTATLVSIALLLSAGAATAKTFYLKDGATIEYRKVWQQGGLIHVLINRDTLVSFMPEEVDLKRTLRAAGLKKFPTPRAEKRRKAATHPATRKKAAQPGPQVEKSANGEKLPSVSGDDSGPSSEGDAPPQASVNGKYADLLQVMNCPRDQGSYGEFRDYGWWNGGPWCGQSGKAGYWVWVAPNWYVWANRR